MTQLVPDAQRTHFFAWYNLAGSFATATGALAAGWLAQGLQNSGWTAFESYRVVLIGYAMGGALLLLLFSTLTNAIEVKTERYAEKRILGLHRSRNVVFKLSSLFALDAFAGGLLVQSLIAFWFHVRFGVDAGILGSIFFGANILAGFSALLAVPLAKRFGLINTTPRKPSSDSLGSSTTGTPRSRLRASTRRAIAGPSAPVLERFRPACRRMARGEPVRRAGMGKPVLR